MYIRNSDFCIEDTRTEEYWRNENEQQDEDYLIDKYLSDIESEERYYDKLYGNK